MCVWVCVCLSLYFLTVSRVVDVWQGLPFVLQRRQFPIRPCFAMTINKSQGQTLGTCGVYLPSPVFSHGISSSAPANEYAAPVLSWSRMVLVCPAVLTRGTNRAIVRGLVSCRQILGSPCSRVSARGRRSRQVTQTVSRHVHTECRVFRGFKRLLIGVHPRDK